MELWEKFKNTIPNIVTSLVFLLIGMYLARATKTVLSRMLSQIHLDEHTSKLGINEILARVGFGKSPAFIIVFVAYWTIMLIFFILAANALELNVISQMLSSFVFFVPKLVAATLILFGGILFGRFSRQIIENSATANNLPGGMVVSRVVSAAIVFFAALMALEQIGVAMTIAREAFLIILASAGLGFAISLGLGTKDAIAQFVKEKIEKEKE